MNELELQVNKQTQEIETFISTHNKNHRSSHSFGVLVTLYELFQRQIMMNEDLKMALKSQKMIIDEMDRSLISLAKKSLDQEIYIGSDINAFCETIRANDKYSKLFSPEKVKKNIKAGFNGDVEDDSNNMNQSRCLLFKLASRKLARSKSKIRMLEKIKNKMKSENSDLQESINMLTSQYNSWKEELNSIRKILKIKKHQSKELKEAPSSIKIIIDEIHAQIEELNIKNAQLTNEKKDMMNRIRELTIQKQEIDGKNIQMKSNYTSLKAKYSELEDSKYSYQREVQYLREQNKALEDDLKKNIQKCNDTEKVSHLKGRSENVLNMKNEYDQQNSTIQELKMQNSRLMDIITSKNDENAKLQKSVQDLLGMEVENNLLRQQILSCKASYETIYQTNEEKLKRIENEYRQKLTLSNKEELEGIIAEKEKEMNRITSENKKLRSLVSILRDEVIKIKDISSLDKSSDNYISLLIKAFRMLGDYVGLDDNTSPMSIVDKIISIIGHDEKETCKIIESNDGIQKKIGEIEDYIGSFMNELNNHK